MKNQKKDSLVATKAIETLRINILCGNTFGVSPPAGRQVCNQWQNNKCDRSTETREKNSVFLRNQWQKSLKLKLMNPKILIKDNYPLQQETSRIISLGIEIHKILGPGFLEIVYKDAFEHEFRTNQIFFEREKEFLIEYKNSILKHRFYADFVVFENIILEIKAKKGGIAEEDYAQAINYLKCSGCKIGLILNFAKLKLEIKE